MRIIFVNLKSTNCWGLDEDAQARVRKIFFNFEIDGTIIG